MLSATPSGMHTEEHITATVTDIAIGSAVFATGIAKRVTSTATTNTDDRNPYGPMTSGRAPVSLKRAVNPATVRWD